MDDTTSLHLARVLLLASFTPEELALLTPGEIRLLIALTHQDLPEISEQERLDAHQEYEARVQTALRRRIAQQSLAPGAQSTMP